MGKQQNSGGSHNLQRGHTDDLNLVGDRNIWYAEVLIIKDKKRYCGFQEIKTKKEAKKILRKEIKEKFGNKKYKILQLFKLPSEMVIDEEK